MKSISGGAAGTFAAVSGDTDLPTGGPSTIALDPGNEDTLYVGYSSGMFKTTIGGASFSASGLSSLSVSVIRVSGPSSTVYAIASNSVYQSTDSGANWTDISDGLPGGTDLPRSLVADPIDPDVLYLTTSHSGVWSKDGANDWEQMTTTGLLELELDAIAIDPNGKLLHVGAADKQVWTLQLRE